MKKLKKILSIFLVAIILLPTLVVGVQAEGPEKIYFKFIYNNYIPIQYICGWNYEDVHVTTDDHWHGFEITKRNEFEIPTEARADNGFKTISIYIDQRKGTKISATLTAGNESKTFTIDSPNEKDIKLGKTTFKFEVLNGNKMEFSENRSRPSYVPFTEDLTVQVDFQMVNFEEYRQSFIDDINEQYGLPEKESLFEEGLKSALKTVKKEFSEAKNQENIMNAAKKFFDFTNKDYAEKREKEEAKYSELNDKVYKKKSDGTYLFSKDIRDNLYDNHPNISTIYNCYPRDFTKSLSDQLAEFDLYLKKVDVIVKKAEIKEKLKDHDENYEPIFTQEQKEEFERKIDAINDDDADALEKLAKIEKDVDTIRDAKNATQEEKDAAKEEIGNLPNLSDTEKDKYKGDVDNAQTKGEVAKAVEDAKAQDAENKAAAEEKNKPATPDDKNKAKEEIGNLPNLSDTEKDKYKGDVDNAQTKGEVAKAVEDAKAQDAENKAAAEEKNKPATPDDKNKAKEEIGNLPNLSDTEKDKYKGDVDNAQTKGEVAKAVEDAKAQDAENKAAAEEKNKPATPDDKNKAKDEIDKLPNLSDTEKDKYKKQVDDTQTKGDVAKIVDEAKAKSGVPAPEPSPTPNPSVDRDHDYWNRTYWTYSYGTSNTTIQKPVKTNLVKLESKLVIGSKEMIKSVDGVEQKINMDIAPFIEGNRTMLPIRFVAESLGFNVQWDKESRTVILIDKENVVKIPVDTNQIIVNGKVYESDVKPVIRNNRTMLPIANIARALGLKDGTDIIWNAATKEVKINIEIEK